MLAEKHTIKFGISCISYIRRILNISFAFVITGLLMEIIILPEADAFETSGYENQALINSNDSHSSGSGNFSNIKIKNGVPKISINGEIINNMFGIYCYSTGISPMTDQFLDDMKAIVDRTKALGIPILGFDILWEDYDKSTSIPRNPQEAAERFYTKNLDKILNYAAEKNVYVILQLLVHSHWGLPKWWKEFQNNKSEYQLIDYTSDPSGTYNRLQTPVASFQSKTHRELLKALITRLVKRYSKHPAIAGWAINIGPTGENGYAPNDINMMFNRSLPRIDHRFSMADYSRGSKNRFIQWLQKKYDDIEVLNKAWESNFVSFADVLPPNPKKITTHETFQQNGDQRPSMKDWQLFRYEAITDEWRFLTDLVRSLDSSKIIMGKTSWVPAGDPSGTTKMIASADSVYREHMIDLDKIDVGITMHDYMPHLPLWSSRIDYTHFAKFSRKNNIVRVLNFENWIGSFPSKTPGERIPIERSVSVKNAIQQEGAYMWLTVKPDNFRGYPSWSWNELRDLVTASTSDELKGVNLKKASVLFYYDISNLMNHYFEENVNLSASKIRYNIAKSLFETKGKPEYAFISKDDVETDLLNVENVDLLIVVNQRIISNKTLNALNKYIANGGSVLLIGSNGIFNDSSQKNNFAIKSLVPELSDEQIQDLYDWGIQRTLKIPVIVTDGYQFRFEKLSVNGNPNENYQLLKNILPRNIIWPEQGKLMFTSNNRKMKLKKDEKMNFVKDFDKNRDGVVSEQEFPGPKSFFKYLDTNNDGRVTLEEARDKNQ